MTTRKPQIRAISAERFAKLLDRLGLSQRAAARFLGIDERMARHFVAGTKPVDPRTAMLLELMVKQKVSPQDALRLIGISPRAAIKVTKQELGPLAAPRFYEDRRG